MDQSKYHTQPTAADSNQDVQSAMVHIRDLYKSFGSNHVLRGFNMDLYPGENLVIIGKSGSGKSVLVKCLVGLIEPDSGILKILDQDITQLVQKEMDELRTEIGFLFQGSALYDSMTVRENLEFPLRRHPDKVPGSTETDSLVEGALESVGLLHAIDLMPEELSGGMKRRVALARALMLDPKVIVYDEPTSGLDPITAKEIIQLIMDIQNQRGTASIIITHDMDCARVIANRMIILVDGVNYAEGTYQELYKNPDQKVKAFFK